MASRGAAPSGPSPQSRLCPLLTMGTVGVSLAQGHSSCFSASSFPIFTKASRRQKTRDRRRTRRIRIHIDMNSRHTEHKSQKNDSLAAPDLFRVSIRTFAGFRVPLQREEGRTTPLNTLLHIKQIHFHAGRTTTLIHLLLQNTTNGDDHDSDVTGVRSAVFTYTYVSFFQRKPHTHTHFLYSRMQGTLDLNNNNNLKRNK